jgi:dihydrofolate synthase / folylpolyglutamate synthase
MNYEETIQYLLAQLPMFSRIGGAAYKEDITNTVKLMEFLGNPHHQFKSIHIAGTNGKGSTSHMIAAMLQKQGYKTGLYTSPHINDFRERIRINGQMIEESFVVTFTETVKSFSESISPSFFELTVAMAFDYFAKEKIDIAVIETGMGGRLDSTNVINPILSVITNIGMDHTALLGDSIPKIAFEKAGIIKQHVPVIIGERDPESENVFFEKAINENSEILFASDTYEVSHVKLNHNSIVCDVTDTFNGHTEHFQLDLSGSYQLKNIKTVLAAEYMLHKLGFPIDPENEKYALAHVKQLTGIHGRWDLIGSNPYIYCDVAHNTEGIQEILHHLQKNHPHAHYHFIMGFVRDKDLGKVIDILPRSAKYYFSNAHIPRALPHEELLALAIQSGLSGKSFDDVNDALDSAKADANEEDVIVICGSFFILAELNHYKSPNFRNP